MEELFFEVFLIAILILLNGYLAGTEIAVVTARKSHIKQMAESGKRNAKIFLKLKEEPDRFLATIQIGITTVWRPCLCGRWRSGRQGHQTCPSGGSHQDHFSRCGTHCHRDRCRHHHLFFRDLW